ncbi:glycosyltransferase family 4 protein [Candidatus Woesearchaeota archaeon]|nr:glycosyltransferase family 4 protein [Candidatus Woesearchaeota archaeon]
MRVLMFGWEYPPIMSGGLGTACRSLCIGLARQGVNIAYVMPHDTDGICDPHVAFVGAGTAMRKIKTIPVRSPITAYMTSQQYSQEIVHGKSRKGIKALYGSDLYDEVWRFGAVAGAIALEEPHDVIHAHDWMTYPAAISAKRASGKPLVVHIHNTSYDRTGGKPNPAEYDIERHGFNEADHVIAISNMVKNALVSKYEVPESKISVVHWGIEEDRPEYHLNYASPLKAKHPLVLFLGRMTIQKGPDWFIEVARKVSDYVPDARFIMAGTGDMLGQVVHRVSELGLADRVIFTGGVQHNDVHRVFQTADVYVMPSISEPFGLVALEALKNNTPVIVSKQSGVSEVLTHALKADFWDVDGMANQIIGLLSYKACREELRDNGHAEVQKLGLDEPARKTIDAYKRAIQQTR